MNVTVMDRQARYRRRRPISALSIATCIPTRSRRPISMQFLPERWRKHRASIGGRSRAPFANAPNYPRMSPFTGMRMDSWPKDGTHPGSDLEMMQEQLLDLFNVSYGLMMPLLGRGADERNVEFGAAMATAANEWEAQVWCDREPRLKAGVQITTRIHRGRDQGDREARRRPPLHPRDDPAARTGAAGPSPLLADPGGLRRQRLSRSRCISAAPAGIRRPAAAGRRSITRSIRPIRRARRRWSPSW